VGLGFDVHAWAAGRPLLLGGIGFEGEGLEGHSDGDVVCHALADAILGAVALGDVGEHFPDTDPAFAGIGGLDLLGRVVGMVRDAGAHPVSADLTVVAERPSIAPAREEMRRALGVALDVATERVSVKATRPEGLGLTGEGVGCLAIVLLARS
jgi:2-C-methyl-D-erythritol 4-phosphate cytidylyltransferase/2-C-methyl-D-erythritol 2,4-cyclodiphosphate synthase